MSKVMIVTGGGRGIGAAISRRAGERGYSVAVNYTQAKDRAEEVVSDIEKTGGRAIAVQADMGLRRRVRGVVYTKRPSKVQILVDHHPKNIFFLVSVI